MKNCCAVRVFFYHERHRKYFCEWQKSIRTVKPSETTRSGNENTICAQPDYNNIRNLAISIIKPWQCSRPAASNQHSRRSPAGLPHQTGAAGTHKYPFHCIFLTTVLQCILYNCA